MRIASLGGSARLIQEAAEVGVGRRVHVDREGGQGMLSRIAESPLVDPVVALHAEGQGRTGERGGEATHHSAHHSTGDTACDTALDLDGLRHRADRKGRVEAQRLSADQSESPPAPGPGPDALHPPRVAARGQRDDRVRAAGVGGRRSGPTSRLVGHRDRRSRDDGADRGGDRAHDHAGGLGVNGPRSEKGGQHHEAGPGSHWRSSVSRLGEVVVDPWTPFPCLRVRWLDPSTSPGAY
jgi:hypothetical protein